jgi:nucleoid-associated protein YgaU
MRAALWTTALVLLVLVAWANLRGSPAARSSPQENAASAPARPLPDVAAAPPPSVSPTARDVEATYEPAAGAARERKHVVAAGETLASISRLYYQDDSHAEAIYQANRDQIRDPAQLHEGQTLILP